MSTVWIAAREHTRQALITHWRVLPGRLALASVGPALRSINASCRRTHRVHRGCVLVAPILASEGGGADLGGVVKRHYK